MACNRIVIGTAGWSIPSRSKEAFPPAGSHLERYASVFSGVEINSSFHRPHATRVYEKWAALTPPDFRFSVKLPRAITHEGRLRKAKEPLERFLSETAGLGPKRGPLLIQLPPSLELDTRVARRFLGLLRDRHNGVVVCEPRHASWFTPTADALLTLFQVGRVAADPSPLSGAAVPGGWTGSPGNGRVPTAYYRLHGSPRKYWSRYPPERLAGWAEALACLPAGTDGWCIFDNTASGAAAENALELVARFRPAD
jgi:uncharacterized protein YecE (DUF72 family)